METEYYKLVDESWLFLVTSNQLEGRECMIDLDSNQLFTIVQSNLRVPYPTNMGKIFGEFHFCDVMIEDSHGNYYLTSMEFLKRYERKHLYSFRIDWTIKS